MDECLELSLIEVVKNDIQNFIDLGYKQVGNISKQQFDEKTNIATVHVALKKDPMNYLEKPLEKYFKYRLIDNEIKPLWSYVNSDG